MLWQQNPTFGFLFAGFGSTWDRSGYRGAGRLDLKFVLLINFYTHWVCSVGFIGVLSAVSQQGDVQAAPPGFSSSVCADRQLPARERQREPGCAADGSQVQRSYTLRNHTHTHM